MEKKEYIEPSLKIIELGQATALLAGSLTARGYRVSIEDNDDDDLDEEVQSVYDIFWTR